MISYAYLWREEALARAEEGRKHRPCLVVGTTLDAGENTVVLVAPITHLAPRAGAAFELPARVKRQLRMDDARSWVILTELNRFLWPGLDLRPINRDAPGVFAWGFLPASLLSAIRQDLMSRKPAITPRT